MAHVPHIVLRGPWEGPIVPLPADTERHLRGVLRLPNGEAVEYTDGKGVRGSGVLGPSGLVRGDEHRVEPPGRLVVAVAPLKAKDRMRFLVEKLTEVGVSEVWWLSTRFGQVPAPSAQRVDAWAVGALEQSRGAWLPRFRSAGWPDVVSAGLDAVVCDPTGDARGLPIPGLVVVGPEGGFATDEIPAGVARVSLGPSVLRTETAAIAAVVLARLG